MLVYIAVTNKMMVCFVERQGIFPVSDFIKNGPVAGKLSQNYCNKSWSLQSIHFESPIIFTKIAWTIKLCGYPVLKPTPKLSLGLKILLIINGCRINETGKMGFLRKLRGCWEFATQLQLIEPSSILCPLIYAEEERATRVLIPWAYRPSKD
jgi:hypothetical protein